MNETALRSRSTDGEVRRVLVLDLVPLLGGQRALEADGAADALGSGGREQLGAVDLVVLGSQK